MSEDRTIELPPIAPRKKLRDFKAWLNSLPPHCDDFDIEAVVGCLPSASKRVIAYESKDGTGGGICVNSMGSHLQNEFWSDVEIINFWTP